MAAESEEVDGVPKAFQKPAYGKSGIGRGVGSRSGFDPYDPEDVARLCHHVEVDGLTPVSAAQALGISKPTFYAWMEAIPSFSDRLKAAQATLKLTLSKRVMAQTGTQWQAAMTVLERLWPEEYGRRDRVRHEVSGHIGLGIEPAKMNEAAILHAASLEEELAAAEVLELPPHEPEA